MFTRMKVLAALSIAALVLAGGMAWAQGPGSGPQGPGPGIGPGGPGGGPGLFAQAGRHGRMGRHGFFGPRLIRALDLSEEQIKQAREIRENTRRQVQPLAEEQRALRQELRTALEGEAPSSEAVGSIVISLHQNRQQVRDLHQQALTDFEAILTPEQLERFQQFRERRQDRRFGPRHRGNR